MNALEPLTTKPETLADWLLAVARGTVVLDVVKEQVDRLRDGLARQVDVMSETTGTAFTARVGGVGQALMTDPQPKATVIDPWAFARWLATDVDPDGTSGLWASRERVEVHDHARVAKALAALDDGIEGDIAKALADGDIEVVTEFLPSESALDTIIARRRVAFHESDDGWTLIAVDEDGQPGETVPGVRVSRARPTLQVRLDSKARKQAQFEVRDALGLPEIGGAS